MPSLGAMKARIANEIARPDLSAEITDAIGSAIAHYEGMRFAFNEALGTFSTVIGQDWYTAAEFADLANAHSIDTLRVFVPSSWLPMHRRTWPEMQWLTTSLSEAADPTDWTYYSGRIRVSPIPTEVRSIEVAYVAALGVPADDATGNAWTNEAEALIRHCAKADLFENVIRDPSEADRLRLREQEALRALRRRAASLGGSGGVEAHYL